MEFERGHEHENRNDDEAQNASTPMFRLVVLHVRVRPQPAHTNEAGKLTTDILRSPNFSQRSSIVYNPTRAVTKRPTILTLPPHVRVVQVPWCAAHLVTHPIETPVKKSHIHQSTEKDLRDIFNAKKQIRHPAHLLVLMIMEFCQTENSKECEEQQHRVQ